MSDKIELQEVSVAFSTTTGPHHVLRNVTYLFSPGSWTAVIGANGSGKSTMGRVILGLCDVSKGTVVRTSHRTSRRPHNDSTIQIVFQNPEAQIIGQTVYEDVCFGLENIALPTEEMPKRAEEALHRVGLTRRQTHPVEKLSGGQKQLLCIAGCLAVYPGVIVFDEATSMLNPASRQLVLEKVKQLHADGMTVIWITQWLEELSYADHVVALKDGAIAYQGDVETFFYGRDTTATPCDDLGFEAPYVVQVARALTQSEVPFPGRPLTVSELENALEVLCQSD